MIRALCEQATICYKERSALRSPRDHGTENRPKVMHEICWRMVRSFPSSDVGQSKIQICLGAKETMRVHQRKTLAQEEAGLGSI